MSASKQGVSVPSSNPKQEEALLQRGRAKLARGDYDDAEALFRRVLMTLPNSVEAHHNLAIVLQQTGRSEGAAGHLRLVITLEPHYGPAHFVLGVTLEALGRIDDAMESYLRATALMPRDSDAHLNLANVLLKRGDLDKALKHARRAVALDPRSVSALHVLGIVLRALGRIDEARKSLSRAISLPRSSPEAHNNLGTALVHLNRLDEAIACYQQAVALRPDYVEAHYNEALAQLLRGNMRIGWEKHEWRWKRPASAKISFSRPLWLGGEGLGDKEILLCAEQGLGDTLQFVRYAPLVAEQGARVFLLVQPGLKSLLSSVPGVKAIYGLGDRLPDFDLYCPLMSLPLAFSTELETIPRTIPYIRASEKHLAKWRDEFSSIRKPRIGIAWSGNPKYKRDYEKSIPLTLFRQILDEPECQFYILQTAIKDADLAILPTIAGLVDLRSRIEDFSDTAAIVGNLDLVISVDTSAVHLSGAMGKPTWVLLPFSPDWRWLLGRDDNPWYPTARLYRQDKIGDWKTVLSNVCTDLKAFVAGRF